MTLFSAKDSILRMIQESEGLLVILVIFAFEGKKELISTLLIPIIFTNYVHRNF